MSESFKAVPINGWPHFSHGFWPLFEAVLRLSALEGTRTR